MAKRYSGTLELTIKLCDDDSYSVRIRELNDDARFAPLTGLRLSPYMQARFALDAALTYDEVARAALGWASNFDDAVCGFAASTHEGDFSVRRRLRTGV